MPELEVTIDRIESILSSFNRPSRKGLLRTILEEYAEEVKYEAEEATWLAAYERIDIAMLGLSSYFSSNEPGWSKIRETWHHLTGEDETISSSDE